MGVREVIKEADALLEHRPWQRKPDERWPAIVAVGRYVQSNPESVWQFARKWCVSEDKDVRNALATIILEHLLEYHFDAYFDRVEALASENDVFADTFVRCWKFGQAEKPHNAKKFDELRDRILESKGHLIVP